MKPIYLDSNATTPVDERVLAEMIPYFNIFFGNPASVDHIYGNEALGAVNKSRKIISQFINARPEEIIFTSGATESDNLALIGFARKNKPNGNHIITTKIEHKAILDSCLQLEREQFNITYLSVDENGNINLNDLESAITEKTILVSIMHANNEIGTINNIQKIGEITKKHKICFHTDVAQSLGYIPIDVEKMHIDLLSASGHKLYAPKGIGFLYVRSRNPEIELKPIIFGGGHERRMRSGTLNVPSIVGLSKAIEICKDSMSSENKKLTHLRNKLWSNLSSELNIKLNGDLENRLPNNLNIIFHGIEAKALINELKDIVALSAGSACTSTNVDVSHVLKAMGLTDDEAHCSIRFGLTRSTTEEEIDKISKAIISKVKYLITFFS